jgi:hypothetical protein
MGQLPGDHALVWSHARVIIVHVWNGVGLVISIILFTGTTAWGVIPLSNLFYSLVGQTMAWGYQYFHMVECTQTLKSNKLSMRYITKGYHAGPNGAPRPLSYYSTELRKLIYMEFSVVAPMFMVAGIMPGTIGIDEWRVQTVLFASWALFALLGLHLRFRKALKRNALKDSLLGEKAPANEYGTDALGYLTFAIMLVFMMLINAMGRTQFYDAPYATPEITYARWAARVLTIVAAVMVLEAIVLAVVVRFFPSIAEEEGKSELSALKQLDHNEDASEQPGEPEKTHSTREHILESVDPNLVPSFILNILIIGSGSVMVKVLIFAGLVNVDALSHWA